MSQWQLGNHRRDKHPRLKEWHVQKVSGGNGGAFGELNKANGGGAE